MGISLPRPFTLVISPNFSFLALISRSTMSSRAQVRTGLRTPRPNTYGHPRGDLPGRNPHYLGRFRVLVVELARLHAIPCRVYGLGPETVSHGTCFRRCPFLSYIRRVGWSCRRHAPPCRGHRSVGSRKCHTMRIAARDPTLAHGKSRREVAKGSTGSLTRNTTSGV